MKSVVEIIDSCGGDAKGLEKDVEGFFAKRVPVTESSKPIQSAGFQSVMERAILHTASAEKPTVEIGDIFVSMLEEKESFAAHFLARQGIDRLTLLTYISHGVSAFSEGEENEDMEGEDEEAASPEEEASIPAAAERDAGRDAKALRA